MGASNDVTTMAGNFKEKYAQDILRLIPASNKLTRKVPFTQTPKLGNYFHRPVILTDEHGFTYSGGANAGSAFTLNASVALTSKDAQVQGSEIALKSTVSYGALHRGAGQEKAVEDTLSLLFKTMQKSASKRLELAMLYGQRGIGTLNATSGSSTTRTYTLTTSAWATGIWMGMVNAPLDVYQSDLTTKINTNASVLVTSVIPASRQITVSGNATDLTSIDTYNGGGADRATFFFLGANGNEMAGIDKIVTNTGSLFGIDASAYELWKGTSYPVGSAALTLGKIQDAAAVAAGAGLDEGATLYVNTRTFGNIVTDQAALRKYDARYNSANMENGAESVTFYAQTGTLQIEPHIFVKEGEAFMVPTDRIMRVGSTDWTFNMPDGESFFYNDPSVAGYVLRMYTDQGILIESPARCVKFTGIVNN